MTDASVYHAVLGEMVEDLEKQIAKHEADALAFDEKSTQMLARDIEPQYSRQKAEEHREEADILRRRIEALRAGMACLTW